MVTNDTQLTDRDRAIESAWAFVRSKAFKVLSLDSCQYFDEEKPEWVVRFQLELPEDVACGGELLLVTVDCKEWTACLFESL
jgi:hypothetical protein